MRAVLVLVACSAPATAPLTNHVPHAEPRDASIEEEVACGITKLDPNADTRHRLVGAVCDPIHQTWLHGATVVVVGPGLAKVKTSITDQWGVFVFAGMPDGDFQVTIYYADHEVDHRVTVPAKPVVLMFDVW